MPQEGLIFRILVASPSDCIQERKLIPEVIYSWNAATSFLSAAIIEPVMWETHAIPELGDRPQALINKQLVKKCDILVGTFWTRLGTDTGKAESGTVEEIEEFRKENKPVLLYFSSVPVVPESIDHNQYEALSKYKKKFEKDGIIFKYDSVGSLREQFQRHLSSTMASLLPLSSPESPYSADDSVNPIQMFKLQFEHFLRGFEAEWELERDSEPVDIEGGKYIIENALREILEFRKAIVKDDETLLSEILKEASNRLKILTQHDEQLMDGNQSYNEFWREGDEIVKLVKKVSQELDKALERRI
jgi:hypothetical protein